MQGCHSSPFPFSNVLEVPANAIRRGTKRYRNWEGRNETIFVHRWSDRLCKKMKIIHLKNLELIRDYSKVKGCRLMSKRKSLF